MEKSHKFVVLDAFRGVAALIVVVYHVWPMFGAHFFPHGYLAVDFFFMLSGFVLTHSYQQRLDQGWGFGAFLKTRVARLYPLYFASLVLSLLLYVAHVVSRSSQAAHPGRFFWLLSLGVLFVPSPINLPGFFPFLFPLNPPAWSLFYEMIVNALHALFGRNRTQAFLILVSAVAGSLLVAMTLHFGTLDAGETLGQFGYALVRVVFGYTFGALLCRIYKTGSLPLPNWPLPATALLIASFATPTSWHHSVVDIIAALVLFPLVVLLGAAATPSRWIVRPSLALGQASYGLYVLHVPVAGLGEQIWFHLRGRAAAADAPWSGLILVALLFIFVLAVDRVYDVPGRRWLARQLHLTASRIGVPAASTF